MFSSLFCLTSVLSLLAAPSYGKMVHHRLVSRATTTAANVSFVLIGDSTTYAESGWSRGFCSSLVDGTFCSDRGASGRTTGTYVSDGYWALATNDVKSEVAKGNEVFVTIQFGHNDQKVAAPSSMAANLTSFVSQVKTLGANPILVTPLARRTFNSTTNAITDTLEPWAEATIGVANATSTALLPLHEASLSYLSSIGNSASQLLNRYSTDTTHLDYSAQLLFGRMVADLTQIFAMNYYTTITKLASPFNTNPAMSQALYTGKQYVYNPNYNADPCYHIQVLNSTGSVVGYFQNAGVTGPHFRYDVLANAACFTPPTIGASSANVVAYNNNNASASNVYLGVVVITDDGTHNLKSGSTNYAAFTLSTAVASSSTPTLVSSDNQNSYASTSDYSETAIWSYNSSGVLTPSWANSGSTTTTLTILTSDSNSNLYTTGDLSAFEGAHGTAYFPVTLKAVAATTSW